MRLSDVIQENLRVPNQDQCIPGGAGLGCSGTGGQDGPHVGAVRGAECEQELQFGSQSGVADRGNTDEDAWASSRRAQNCCSVLVFGRGPRLARTIQPRIIFTALAKDELTGPRSERYRRMIELSLVGRGGTPDDVGAVGALLGPRGHVHHRQ